MLARWLRLWFGFSEPVNRRTYFTHGLGLMLGKYTLDVVLVGIFARRFWTPLDYLNPLWQVRFQLLEHGPRWLPPLLVAVALPFLWIGVSMTTRRLADAGHSPWLALLFFVPVVNLALMAVLCLRPSRSRVVWAALAPAPAVDERLKSALLGVAAALGITLVTVGIGIYLRRSYSTGLFLGLPFTIGYISAYIYNSRFPRSVGESVVIAFAAVTVAGGALVVFALEGLVCTVMAVPIALAVAWPGAVLGRIIAQRRARISAAGGMAMLAPLLVAAEPRQRPGSHEVVTVMEIDAPAAVVWRHVVTFPELPPATEPLFRAGIAAPVRARIEGTGVGAVRYCDFTTGSFVEPVTAWEPGRLLVFDITEQAPPLREWSPYRGVHPPHLDAYFRATRGEFRLTALPGGRTRLEGRTAYEMDMFPQGYWRIPASAVVEAIHVRVLRHIKTLAEEKP